MSPVHHTSTHPDLVLESAASPANHEDLLHLTRVLADAALAPAQRLAVYGRLLGLDVTAGPHPGAAAGNDGLAPPAVAAQLGVAEARDKQFDRLQHNVLDSSVEHQLRGSLEDQHADQELQGLIDSVILAADARDTLQSIEENHVIKQQQPHQQFAQLQVAWQRLLRKQQLQQLFLQQQHQLQHPRAAAQQQQHIAGQHVQHMQQPVTTTPDIAQLMERGFVHQQLYAMFQQQPQQHPQQVHGCCMPAAQVQQQQQTPPGVIGGMSYAKVCSQHPCVPLHSNIAIPQPKHTEGTSARAAAVPPAAHSRNSPTEQQPPGMTDAAAVTAASAAVCGTSSGSVPMLFEMPPPQQQQQQQESRRQRHEALHDNDDDEWLPDQGRRIHHSKPKQSHAANTSAHGSASSALQQQQLRDAPENRMALTVAPHGTALAPEADGSREGQPAGVKRIRNRRNKVAELEHSVEALRQQLSQLSESNAALRHQEQQLEGQLSQKESAVTSMLAHKHKALASQQRLEQQQPSLSSPAQQTTDVSHKLSEPSLGYHSSAFKQDYLPTVNGALPNPGTLPMFSPLPPSAVQVSAQNLTRFVQDARELRAAHTGTDAEPAVEGHLLTRASMLQGLMRRYNVLNPMFVYQLRAVNLSTGKPDSPPPGHWSAMAELMRGLISQQELDNLKLSYRLFKASLRAIKKEQAWVVSQVTTTSQRLQRSKAAGTKQQQDDSSSSTGTSECATAAVTRLPAGGASVSSDQGWTQSSSSSSLDSPLPSEAGLLEQLQLQQQLDDLLRQMEQLLLREHDQHFMLLWCCTKMPSSIRVFMELLLASYPYLVNYHEILPHLLNEG